MTSPLRRGAPRCLGERVVEYVACSLSPHEMLEWDRHLVACEGCRRAVDDERRMLARLAVQPRVPRDLRATLLSMASSASAVPSPPRAPTAVRVAVRRQPVLPVWPAPLPLVAPSAPACHRSPLRSAVFAAVAAGASAAAAWSMAVTGAGGPTAGSPFSGPPAGTLPARFAPAGSVASVTVPYRTATAGAFAADPVVAVQRVVAVMPALHTLQAVVTHPRRPAGSHQGARSLP
jgi:hypothetical protein